MQEVVINFVFLISVGDILRLRWLAIIRFQKLISELWHHVELLKHTNHVANVAQVLNATE